MVTRYNAVCSWVVERPLIWPCVIGSIPHGGPFEIFRIPDCVPQLVQQRPCYILYSLWDGA